MFSCFLDAYTHEKSKGLNGNKYAERWWDYITQIEQSKPDWANYIVPKEDGTRTLIYNFVSNVAFDNFIMAIILLNLITIGMNFETQPYIYGKFLEYINLVFSGIFTLESIFKIIGFGFTRYFNKKWNRFDFFVVCASIVDITITYGSANQTSSILRAFQIIRVLRILRISR